MGDQQGDAVTAALTELTREHRGRIVALLARRFEDLDLADDAVQDALVEAVEHWRRAGVPGNPAGWLLTSARNRAIDRLRRAASARRRTVEAGPELHRDIEPIDEPSRLIIEGRDIPDERLRLILLCCHPALDLDTQVALTLKLVAGLSTQDIAAAFVLSDATLAQRIARGKRKIRDARIPLIVPAKLEERIDAVLAVVYLVFNEGYLSRGGHAEPVRVNLVDEAVRLTRVLVALLPDNPEVAALLALELFTSARQSARLSATGQLILLDDQDRALWDQDRIHEANATLAGAMVRMTPGPYQLQAIIAWHHANARAAADTRWDEIAALYRHLEGMTASPIVALNRAVAVAKSEGPEAGLALLAQVEGIEKYHLLHAVRGEFLTQVGELAAAREAFAVARELARNTAEQAHLERRVAAVSGATAG